MRPVGNGGAVVLPTDGLLLVLGEVLRGDPGVCLDWGGCFCLELLLSWAAVAARDSSDCCMSCMAVLGAVVIFPSAVFRITLRLLVGRPYE